MAKWKCLSCGNTDGVKNGQCAKCGPVQTNPVDKEAMEIAGALPVEPKEIPLNEESEPEPVVNK